MDSSVCAMLVRIHGDEGTVRVNSIPIKNIVTDSNRGIEFVIVVISFDEICRLYGNSSLRYFRRRDL